MDRFISKLSGGILCVVLLMITSIVVAAETRVQPSLISDTEVAVPGSTIRVGVLYTIPDRAHIYWKNPGDAHAEPLMNIRRADQLYAQAHSYNRDPMHPRVH